MSLIDKSDDEIIAIAKPIWDNLVKSSNMKDYGGFTKDFGTQMLFGANEVELGKQWSNNKLLTNLSEDYEAYNLGTLDELYVIAAAVIGGTSFAGGIGTIYGAILGALVMQSLQTGMVLIGFDAAIQQIVVGTVLVVAVWIDSVYRRRAK